MYFFLVLFQKHGFQSLADQMAPYVDIFDENAEPELLQANELKLIKRLWNDKGVIDCYDRRREYQVSDMIKHKNNHAKSVVNWFSLHGS